MFIDSFRGLGTSLVEGCAGDFRQNAAECDRVHPSARRRASGACQSASRRAMADRSPHTRDRSALKTNFAIDQLNLATHRPGTLVTAEINNFYAFLGYFQ